LKQNYEQLNTVSIQITNICEICKHLSESLPLRILADTKILKELREMFNTTTIELISYLSIQSPFSEYAFQTENCKNMIIWAIQRIKQCFNEISFLVVEILEIPPHPDPISVKNISKYQTSQIISQIFNINTPISESHKFLQKLNSPLSHFIDIIKNSLSNPKLIFQKIHKSLKLYSKEIHESTLHKQNPELICRICDQTMTLDKYIVFSMKFIL